MKTLYKISSTALVLLFCSSFFLLACCGTISAGKLETPSGRPEVTIPNTNIQTAMDGVAAWLAVQGKTIIGTSAYTITASYKISDTFLGLPVTPKIFTSDYTIVQNGDDVELYKKTESSQSGDLNGQSDYEEMQKELLQIAEFIKAR